MPEPTAEQLAKLQAQAQAGTAGVAAWEAAQKSNTDYQAQAVTDALAQAALRGAPQPLMDSLAGNINARTAPVAAGLSQAKTQFESDMARQAARESEYSNSVANARTLIPLEAEAKAKGIRTRAEMERELAKINSDAALKEVYAKLDVELARLERAKQDAADAAAKAAAKAGSGSGSKTGLNKLTDKELIGVLAKAGNNNLQVKQAATAESAKPAQGIMGKAVSALKSAASAAGSNKTKVQANTMADTKLLGADAAYATGKIAQAKVPTAPAAYGPRGAAAGLGLAAQQPNVTPNMGQYADPVGSHTAAQDAAVGQFNQAMGAVSKYDPAGIQRAIAQAKADRAAAVSTSQAAGKAYQDQLAAQQAMQQAIDMSVGAYFDPTGQSTVNGMTSAQLFQNEIQQLGEMNGVDPERMANLFTPEWKPGMSPYDYNSMLAGQGTYADQQKAAAAAQNAAFQDFQQQSAMEKAQIAAQAPEIAAKIKSLPAYNEFQQEAITQLSGANEAAKPITNATQLRAVLLRMSDGSPDDELIINQVIADLFKPDPALAGTTTLG